MRAEIVEDSIYLFAGGGLIAVAQGNIKDGWRARAAGKRFGTKRFPYAHFAIHARVPECRLTDIANAIVAARLNQDAA